jgi:hypothetical protein
VFDHGRTHEGDLALQTENAIADFATNRWWDLHAPPFARNHTDGNAASSERVQAYGEIMVWSLGIQKSFAGEANDEENGQDVGVEHKPAAPSW